MQYSKFTIENFRCFNEQQTLAFASPVSGKPGSGITYIVGANNSGKTTVVEGLWIKKGHYLNDSERKVKPPEFKLYAIDGTVAKTVKLLRENAYLFVEDPAHSGAHIDDYFEVISSRRHWSSDANGTNTTESVILSSVNGANPRMIQNIQTSVFLKTIETNPVKYKEFTELVKRVIPDFTDWAVGFETQPYIKYISANGSNHKADFLGDGVISIIRILAHLYEERASGLIIDEPELSLHPLAQKKLIQIIAEYSQKRQIIISTHSPYFINWDYIANGARLNRVSKTGDTDSKIFSLEDVATYSSLIMGSNWRQPFLMDEVTKEIFFADDNILFLEGQEDVGLLREEFKDLSIHMFGYGVRGCGNFKLALTLAKDLGFNNAAVILDKGSQEDVISAELTAAFPDYKIVQWNRGDIRDKSEKTSSIKTGYFDEKGNKKEPAQLDDFSEKIETIKAYFAS